MANSKILNKNAQVKAKNQNKSAIIISLAVLAVAVIIISVLIAKGSGDTVKNSDLVIQKSEVLEKARFYPVEIGGTKLEVIAVKASDGTIRTAFNTCQVCYSSGRGYYVQQGSYLVCQNCSNRFGTDDVEVTRGGCNPVPISAEDKAEDDLTITISKDYLKKAKVIFSNWKN